MQKPNRTILILVVVFSASLMAGENVSYKRSSSAICISPDNSIVCVANPDANSITLISTLNDLLITEILTGSDPRTVCFSKDGTKIIVANMGSGNISVVNIDKNEVERTVLVRGEPFGVIAHPNENLVYITNSVTHEVISVDYETGETGKKISVNSNPRGLAITDDGKTLYVTHFLSGKISVVDTVSFQIKNVISTLSDSNFSQSIILNKDETKAYLPHIRSFTANINPVFDNAVFPVISVIDLIGELNINSERIHLDIADQPVNNPIDAVIIPDKNLVYVLNSGSNDISVIDLETGNGVAHIETGIFPKGVVLNPDTNVMYVNNTLSDNVTVIDAENNVMIDTIETTASLLPDNIKNGKRLFLTTDLPEISTDHWMSCGSCHFDGEHDGKTWDFGGGQRNTTSMEGVADTHPVHWSADRDEIQDFEFTIRGLQAGTELIKNGEPNDALGEPNAGLSDDLDDLAAYANSIRHKQSIFLNGDGTLPIAARRGKKIFFSDETTCVECHIPPLFTDSSIDNFLFVSHDVGTGDTPDEKTSPAFDTPSLRGLYKSSPYLHDGSVETLEQVLTIKNLEDQHGVTSHLNNQEISNLVTYLLTLDKRGLLEIVWVIFP